MSAATSSAGRRALRGLVTAVLALLASVLAAGPAAAIDDATRPDARVTHGPSCRPGGVVVEVAAGSAPYAVTLATTREPDGEDSAEVGPGDTVVLRTGGVAWGETIDGWLEYRALDGSGDEWVDELAGYTFTRPAEEDCAAITAPAAPATVPGAPSRAEASPAGDVPVAPGAAPGGPASASGPARAIEPGGSAPPTAPPTAPPSASPTAAGMPEVATDVVEGAVDLAASATTPDEQDPGSTLAPLLVAAVALAGAAAGLAGSLGVTALRRRRPTPGA